MTQTLYLDWKEVVVFAADGPQPQKLLETDSFRAVLVGLILQRDFEKGEQKVALM